MKPDNELIDRFHGVLVESIRTTAPSYLRETFTVAEIYQSLVPYRTHRDQLGIEMNGDYEDALLRMLAGEGDYLILESEPARDRIGRELQHKNPNTGIYREFAAVEVRLNPDRLPEQLSTADAGPDPQTSLGGLEDAGSGPGGPGRAPRKERPAARTSVASSASSASSADRAAPPTASEEAVTGKSAGQAPSASDCPECGKALPERDTLRFCPHCGSNVLEVPCGSCGEILERGWEYCVACGSPAPR